jgi:hypothetical protein
MAALYSTVQYYNTHVMLGELTYNSLRAVFQ